MPFLSKVLSVDTALSIQAHPDKKLAEILHAKKPDMYKDDNHKPEMAYALGDFVAMCGFRPAEEIAKNLRECVYLRDLIGASSASSSLFSPTVCDEFESAVASNADIKPSLRKLFTAFIEASPAHVQVPSPLLSNSDPTRRDEAFPRRHVLPDLRGAVDRHAAVAGRPSPSLSRSTRRTRACSRRCC